MKTQRNILIAFLLNLGFSVFELLGGMFTGSVAIISDALHDFGDAISIGASWFLERKSHKKPDASYTYGYARFSVLGAAITNLILLFGSAVVVINAVDRIVNPVQIHSDGMIIMAVLGAAMNLAAAWFTHGGASLNEKAVNLHMLEDVLGWVVVLIGGIIIRLTGFTLIDPLMSIGVALFILVNAVRGMSEVLAVFMERAPEGIDPKKLESHIRHMDHVQDVHHIHVWTLDGMNHYLTLHVMAEDCDTWELKKAIRKKMQAHGVDHVTIELERAGEQCDETDCTPRRVQAGCHHHHHHHGHKHHHGHEHGDHDHHEHCNHDHHEHCDQEHHECCSHHAHHECGDHQSEEKCGCHHSHHDHHHHH